MRDIRGLDTAVKVLFILGVIFLVSSVATNSWRAKDKYSEGLWQKCTSTSKSTYCEKVYKSADDCVPAKMGAVIAMMLLSLILLFFAFALSICSLLMKRQFRGATIVLTLIAVMAAVTGLAVYTRYYDDDYYDLSWSYGLGWAGTILIFISTCLYISTVVK